MMVSPGFALASMYVDLPAAGGPEIRITGMPLGFTPSGMLYPQRFGPVGHPSDDMIILARPDPLSVALLAL